MLEEDPVMLLMLMVIKRREYHGQNRNFGFELDLHERVDNRRCNEVMTVNTAVHDETATDDDVVLPAFRQKLGLQRNLEAAGHMENVDLVFLDPCLGEVFGERETRLLANILVPACLDKGDAFGGRIGKAQRGGLIHGFFLSNV